MRIRSYLLALAAGLAACEGAERARAPEPETVTVPAGDSVVVVINEVTSALWLGGRTWAVLAVGDAMVHLADVASGRARQLGAGTAAPLKHPYALFRLGDTLFVADWERGDVTAWSASGDFLRVAADRQSAPAGLPVARDAAGQFFTERAPEPGTDGSGNRDSAAVIRYRSGVADTVGRLAPLDVTPAVGNSGPRFERRVYSGQDRWGTLPDGSVWIARVYQNRVDWTDPTGKRVLGKLLPDRVLEVTNSDRELFLRRFPADQRAQAEALPFAAIHPPFTGAWADGDGRVWLEKSRTASDTVGFWHVVARDGTFARAFQLGGRRRILAEGDGRLLIAERIATGVLLREAPLPVQADTAATR